MAAKPPAMPPLLVDVISARLPGPGISQEHDDGDDKSAVIGDAEHGDLSFGGRRCSLRWNLCVLFVFARRSGLGCALCFVSPARLAGLLLYLAKHTPQARRWSDWRERGLATVVIQSPRRIGWGLRSAQVKEERRKAARGTRSRMRTPPNSQQKPTSGLGRQPASKQCTAQHPTPAPPVVPRETLRPTQAAPPSPPPDACPSSPSTRPALPTPAPTKS